MDRRDPAIAGEVRAVLDRAYDSRQPPDLGPWCRDLASEDASVRAHAGVCLHSLLVTNVADASTGSIWHGRPLPLHSSSPVWLGNVDKGMAEAIATSRWNDGGAAAEPVVVWLVQHASETDGRIQAARALPRVKTAGADDFIREIVRGPHPTFGVLALALEEAQARSLKELLPAIMALRGHYRADVRAAAETAATALAGNEPLPKVAADRLPASVTAWLRMAVDLIAEPVPETAKWCRVTLPEDPPGRGAATTREGYLIGGAGPGRALVQPWGTIASLEGIAADIVPATLAAHARELLRVRAEGEANGVDPEVTSPELMVAAWSYVRGDEATAMQLLVPLLAKASDEGEFFQRALYEVVHAADDAMRRAFVVERDYPRALALAQKLARPGCVDRWWQGRYVDLADQLHRRPGDFRELKLPTASEWRTLRAKLSRREQVTFLAERLRLLNGFETWHGDVDYLADQYAVPFAKLDWDALDDVRVINPVRELLAMQLQAQDLEPLLPLLLSKDRVPVCARWRRGTQWDAEHSSREAPMHHLSSVAATLFETMTGEEIDPYRLRLSEAEANKHVAELRDWCRRSADRSLVERMAARLEDPADLDRWGADFWQLFHCNPARAVQSAIQVARQRPDRTVDMARLLVMLDRREPVDEARRWQTAADPELRFHGNLLVLAADGDTDGAALRSVLEALASGDTPHVHCAVPALLACGRAEAGAFLVRCLQGNGPRQFEPSLEFAQRLLLAGYAEGFLAVSAALQRPAESGFACPPDVAERGNEPWILSEIGSWHGLDLDPDYPSAEAIQKARAVLPAWLRRQWDRIAAGQPSTMTVVRLELPWFDLWPRPLVSRWGD